MIPPSETRDQDDLVDITEEIFHSLQLIDNNQVVKSEFFNLLEGTQAIEMLNPKLDTGLINFSQADLNFDASKPITIDEVIAINNKLLILFVSWLDNSSLPVTVLSCRYVQTLLQNYTALKSTNLPLIDQCSLVDNRLKTSISPDDSFESKLVHLVLKSFIIGLCKFIGVCLNIAMYILYEEEDLTTRSMNLDFLLNVPLQQVLQQIESAINWLQTFPNSEKIDTLVNQLKLLININHLESVYHISLPVLQNSNQSQEDSNQLNLNFLKSGIDQSNQLNFDNITVPKNSFSKFIQSDLDNKNIPINLYELPAKSAHENLTSIFTSIHSFIINCSKIENYNQLLHFLYYDISLNIKNLSVISRAFFQLFFIRDNKSIFGSPNIFLNFEFIKSLISNLVGDNTAVLSPEMINNSGLKQETIAEIVRSLDQSTQELESAVYHTITLYGNNPCRQQQLMSKSLLIWDTLQVAWENFESELFTKFKIGEELASGDIGLTVSSYIYYNKLTLMFRLLLRGFDLELYKEYEYYLIYWYGNYLAKLIIELLQGRIYNILQSKINYIEKTLPKRLKKLKAGIKKQQLKDLIQYNQTIILPKIKTTLEYQSQYLLPSYQGILQLMEGIRMYLIILSAFGIVDFMKSTPNSLASFESLFNLRLKPWSSIGVPRLPTFQHYTQSLNILFIQNASTTERITNTKKVLTVAREKFSSSKTIHDDILKTLKHNSIICDQFLPSTIEHVEASYKQLIKCSIAYSLQIDQLLKLLNEGKYAEINSNNYEMKIDKGYHPYFPNVTFANK